MSRITRFILAVALIALVGLGEMFAATAPSSQARYISFSNVTSTSVDITLVKGNGNNRIIVFSADGTVDTPENSDDALNDANGNFATGTLVKTGSPDIVVDVLNGSQWYTTVTGLTAGVTYKVKVFEFNSDNSAPKNAYYLTDGANNPRSFTTLAGPVNPPTLNVAANVTATTADLSWVDENSDSDGFIFTLWVDQQGQGSGDATYNENSATVSPFVELDLGFTTGFDLTDLVGPSDYKYEVSSYIGNDESASAYGYFFTPEDVLAPTITNIALSDQTGPYGAIYEGDAGNNVTFTVTFSEPMKTWLTPTFVFSNTTDLSYVTGSWNLAGEVFTASFLVSDSDQEYTNETITISNAEDLANNSIDDGTQYTDPVFSIDNKDGVLSDFTFVGDVCYSAIEEDLIQFSITLTELGYNSGLIDYNNFVVIAEDQDNSNQISFTSADAGNGVYLFTTTLANTQAEGEYNLNIQFTDGAGNIVIETHNNLFTIDNTKPEISDVNFANTCVNDADVVTLTFTATDVDGCGTFDESNISVENNTELANDWVFVEQNGEIFTYTLNVPAGNDGTYDVTITATDDAGNEATNTTTGAFTIDNTAPVISTVTTTPGCNNAGDVVNISFDITDAGCGTPQDVTVTGLPAGDGVLSSATVTGTAPYHYVYTYTIGSNDTDGIYKVTVNAKDGAGNAAAPVNATNPFKIDNTAPIIKSTAYDVTCVNGEDVVTLTIAVVEEGCGTFDKSNITISGTTGLENVFENDFIENWASTGTVGDGPTDLLEFGGKLYSANLYGNNISVYDGTSWATAGTYGGTYPTVLAVYNNELYAANENSNDVYKYDGTNWASVGSTGGSQPRGMAVYGANLYVTNYISNSVSVYNGTTWSIAGTYNGTHPIGLVEFGSKLYAANEGSNNISVYDGTNWSIAGTYGGSQPTRLAVYDGQLYASNEGSNNVYVFDGTNWASTGSNPGVRTHGLAVLGDKLYATNWSGNTVTVYDGTSWTTTASYPGNFPRGIANYDGKLYVANLNSDDVLVYNTTDGSGTVSDPYVFTYTLDIDANDPSGPLDITINATDDAGNNAIEVEDLAAFTIDNDAPLITGASVAAACENGGNNVILTFTVAEAGCGTFDQNDITITDNVTTATDTWTYVSGSGSGVYTYTLPLLSGDPSGLVIVSINATDVAGNVATEVQTTFTIDNTIPTIDNVALDKSCVNNGTLITLTFDVTDPVSAQCGALGLAVASAYTAGPREITSQFTSPNSPVVNGDVTTFTYTMLVLEEVDDALFTINILAEDNAGNVSATNTDASFTTDNTKPLISALSVTPSCNNAGDEVTIEFDITEAGCGSLNNVTVTGLPTGGNGTLSIPEITGTSPYHYVYTYTVGTTDVTGNYTVLVDAKDGAGNSAIQAGGATLSDFAVDNFTPEVPGQSSSTACFGVGGEYNFSVTIKEIGCGDFDGDNVVINGLPANGSLNGPTITPNPGQNTYTFDYTYIVGVTTPEGSFPFTLDITDAAGNQLTGYNGFSSTPISVDKTAPTISAIALDKSCVITGDVVAVSFTVTDPTPLCDMDEEFVTISGYAGLGTMGEPTISVVGGLYTYTANLTITSTDPTATLTLTVNAEDMAENAATPVTADILIDNAGPVLSALTVTPDHAGGTVGTVDITFTVGDESGECSTFDASTVVYTVTGPAALQSSITTPPVDQGGGVWKSTLAISNLDQTGNYHISLVAADGLGNASNTLDPNPVELVIDNTPPQISSVTTSHTVAGPLPPAPLLNRADDDGNAPEFYIDVVYNEALDTSNPTPPSLVFHISGKNPTTPVAALVPTTSVYHNSTTIRYSFNLDNTTNLDMRSIGVSLNGAKDLAGNTQTVAGTKGNVFGLDFESPQITEIVPTPNFVVDGTSELGLLFTFTEAMKTDVQPTITFDAGNGPDNATLGQILTLLAYPSVSQWNSASLYTAKYSVNGTYGLDSDPISVGITTATDLAGNPFPGSTESGVFLVDTKEPVCAGIVMSPETPQVILTDLSFEVTVTMDQALDTDVNPTIAFTNTIGNYTIDYASNGYGFLDNETFKFLVTHDGTQENAVATLSISGFQDANSNVQVDACTATFDVDTKKPSISSLTVSESNICGNMEGTEVITITFDEVMDAATAPTITFSSDLLGDGILSNLSGSWNTPTNTVYTATYDINYVAGKKYTGVDISVSGAKDALGNTMATDNASGADKINVDTEAPTVSDIAFTPNVVNRALIGAAGLSVAITYNEAMNSGSTPTIVFNDPQDGTGTSTSALTLEGGSWNVGNTIYTATYTVNDAAVELDGVDATISGASDVCGNVQGSSNPEPSFLVDLIAPTCSTLVIVTDPIYEDDLVQELSISFSEEMDSSPEPIFAFANSSNFILGSGSWSGQVYYNVNATHNGTEEGKYLETVSLDISTNQPTDLAGNPIEVATCTANFGLDTKKPLVSSVTFTPNEINGTGTLSVAVVFLEPMNISVTPTLVFSAGATAFSDPSTVWSDSTHFTAVYTVNDNNVDADDVTVTITEALDAAGNIMLPHTSTETFNIDQVSPTIVGLSVSDALINKAEANNVGYTFTVTATFSEAMNTGVNVPTIAFSPDVTTGSPSLTLQVGTNPAWSVGNTVATWTYTVSDQNVAIEGIDITIAGGEDAFGNATDYTAPKTGVFADQFSIDTENPTIAFDDVPQDGSCVNGTEQMYFNANDGSGFSGISTVEAQINGGTYAAFTNGSLLNTIAGWPGTDGALTLELRATDVAGNETTISRVFTADVTAPAISDVIFTNTCVTTGDLVTVTFDVVEAGCGTFDSGDITITGFTNSFVAAGGNPTGSGTYTYTLLIGAGDSEGSKSVTIAASDDAGNVATPVTTNNAFTIDKTAPNYTYTPVATVCANNTDIVNFSINSNDNTFNCGSYGIGNISASTSLGAATVTSLGGDSYGISVDLSGTTSQDDGSYDIDIVMTDAAGNVRNESISNAFSIDNTKPAITNVAVTPGCIKGGTTATLTFNVTESGCGSFTNSNITVSDNVNTNVTWTYSGFNLGVYTYTLLVDGNDPDGAVDVTVSATDFAGNTVTGVDADDTDFTIDNTAPAIAISNPIANAVVNGTKVVNYTVTETGCGINMTQASFDNSSWSEIPLSGNTLSNYTGFAGLPEGAFTLYIQSTDNAGNIGTKTLALVKDTQAPSVTSVTPSDNLLTIADGGTPFTVAILFNDNMNTSVNPTVVLTANGTVTTPAISGTWNSPTNTIFTASFGNINGASSEEIANMSVTVSNVKDNTEDNGNAMVFPSTTNNVFSIDTKAPTCNSMTNNNADIYENDTEVKVTVIFSEAMAALPLPTFNVTNGSNLTPGVTNWTNTSTFTQVFTHNGTEETTSAKFQVGNLPTDVAGNPVTAQCTTDVEIDTRKPMVQNIAFSTNTINEATSTFSVVVTFDESMNTGVTPTATINNINAAGIFALQGTSGWSGNVYTFDYNLSDGNVNAQDVDVIIEGGEDVAGNTMISFYSTGVAEVDIDQVAPVGTINRAGGQSDPAVTTPINFALTFNESVTGLTIGDIVLTGTAGATTLNLTGSGSTYNVAVSGMTQTGTVIINLASSTVLDAAGNNNTTTTIIDNNVQFDVSGGTIVAAGAEAEPATLSSLVDTQGEAVLNFDFKVTDDGLIDVDGTPTPISSITISQGAGNDLANWTNVIAGATLTDQDNNTVTASAINSNSIEFTGLANGVGQIGHVADNAAKTYTLKVWLLSSPTVSIDNQNLDFKVNRSSFTVSGGGSTFASGAGADVESGATNNEIDVIATKLAFTTTPTNTEINTNTTFVLEAQDANGNRDVDYGSSLTSFLANQSTITSGNTGSLSSGTLTLNAVKFSTAFANDYVTAKAAGLSDGVSDNFNIREATPAAITSLSIIPNRFSFKINWSNPDKKNSLIIAKFGVTTLGYSNEAGMDNETTWSANTNYGSSATPSDPNTFVIYAGPDSTVTMLGLQNGFKRYTVAAYAYAGTINSGTQNFNDNEVYLSRVTNPKEADYSEGIAKGLRLGIDNISPQPANLNNVVSLQVETIEDMPLTLELYDSKGQKMMTLFEGRDFTSGETPFEFNLTNTISSGQHFLRLTGNGHVVIAPLMIVK